MIISKISRGLVVIVFVITLLFMMSINFYSLAQGEVEFGSIYLKVLYTVLTVIAIIIFSIIKGRLSNKNVSKKKNAIIRYTFIIIFSFVIKFVIGVFTDPKQIVINAFIFSLMAIINGFLLKKIIYNISKSDVLSALGFVLYMFLPNVSYDSNQAFRTYFLVFFILLIIMFMEMIIDELKQIGLKNKKYILLSIVCSMFVTISMFMGINSLVWITLLIVIFLCTSNLDRTHINFPNKFINMLRQKSKELLYRFERIYINKIIIVLFVITICTLLMYFVLSYIDYNIFNTGFLGKLKCSTNNVFEIINEVRNVKAITIINNLSTLVCNSKVYTIITIVYILFIEVLNVVLRRKYDTKSSIIKAMFVLMVLSYSILGLDFVEYTQVMQMFLVLIAIINTTNLYLNRDERIKLLNS